MWPPPKRSSAEFVADFAQQRDVGRFGDAAASSALGIILFTARTSTKMMKAMMTKLTACVTNSP